MRWCKLWGQTHVSFQLSWLQPSFDRPTQQVIDSFCTHMVLSPSDLVPHLYSVLPVEFGWAACNNETTTDSTGCSLPLSTLQGTSPTFQRCGKRYIYDRAIVDWWHGYSQPTDCMSTYVASFLGQLPFCCWSVTVRKWKGCEYLVGWRGSRVLLVVSVQVSNVQSGKHTGQIRCSQNVLVFLTMYSVGR